MYEDLVSHLRDCAKIDQSENTYEEAADAIEKLEQDLMAVNVKLLNLMESRPEERAPVIVLDEGVRSNKVISVGTIGEEYKFGVLNISRYKDGEERDYDEKITPDDLGDSLVTIMFGRREGIKKMADYLYKLHDQMVVD